MPRYVIEKVKLGDGTPADVVGLRKTITLPDLPASIMSWVGLLTWLLANPPHSEAVHEAILDLLEAFTPPHLHP